MTIARYAIAAILALAVGAAAGMFSSKARYSQALEETQQKLAQVAAQNTELQGVAEKLSALELENDRLRRDNESLRAAPTPAAMQAVDPAGELAAPEEAPTDAAAAPADTGEGDGDRRRAPPQPGEPGYEEWQARRAQWEQERSQRGAEFRERMEGFFDDAIQRAPDAAVQNRLASIKEYSDYSMDLMREMRDAQTDEERDALREELAATWDTTRTLVREQQDYLLKESLKANGISNSQQQQALVDAMRQTMEDPFFRMPTGGGGPGGPGGWGGGPGGWGGRGDGGGGR